MDIYESVKKEKAKRKRRTAEEMAAATDKRIAELEAMLAKKKEEKRKREKAVTKSNRAKRNHRLIELGLLLINKAGGEDHLYEADDEIWKRVATSPSAPMEAAQELIKNVPGHTTVGDMVDMYREFCGICTRHNLNTHDFIIDTIKKWRESK